MIQFTFECTESCNLDPYPVVFFLGGDRISITVFVCWKQSLVFVHTRKVTKQLQNSSVAFFLPDPSQKRFQDFFLILTATGCCLFIFCTGEWIGIHHHGTFPCGSVFVAQFRNGIRVSDGVREYGTPSHTPTFYLWHLSNVENCGTFFNLCNTNRVFEDVNSIRSGAIIQRAEVCVRVWRIMLLVKSHIVHVALNNK